MSFTTVIERYGGVAIHIAEFANEPHTFTRISKRSSEPVALLYQRFLSAYLLSPLLKRHVENAAKERTYEALTPGQRLKRIFTAVSISLVNDAELGDYFNGDALMRFACNRFPNGGCLHPKMLVSCEMEQNLVRFTSRIKTRSYGLHNLEPQTRVEAEKTRAQAAKALRAVFDGDIASDKVGGIRAWISEPAHLPFFKMVKEINLSGLELTALPAEIALLEKVVTLTFAENLLMDLPDACGTLVNLESISLLGNRLPHIPRPLFSLFKIRTLNLHGNQITEIPEEISKLSQLTELRIGSNKLQKLPTALGKLTDLRYLAASNNALTTLPVELNCLVHLTEFSVPNNPITTVPQALKESKIKAIRENEQVKTAATGS